MKIVLIILTFLTLQSCVVHNVTKHQDGDTCKLHNEKMKKTLVGTRYGKPIKPCINYSYPNAKRKKCMGCVVPIWPTRRIAIVYHCKSCDRIKKESGNKDKNPFY